MPYYPNPSVTDHSGTDTGSTQAILTAIGATKNATLIFRHSSGGNTTAYAFANNVTVPTNVAIKVEEGALLTVANSKTLTINGPFEAGLYQVFNGTGTVTFGSGSIKYQHTEWSGTAETITANDLILGGSGGLYAKSTVAENRILGRITGGNIDDLTITQVLDMISASAAEGDLLYRGASAWTRLAKGTAGQVLSQNSGATAPEWITPHQYLIVADQKSQNTAGGTFTAGAWRTRDLNTSVYNNISGASLASNQITLPAGTYRIRAIAPAFGTANHQAQLYNTTASAQISAGSAGYSHATSPSQTSSIIESKFTLAVSSVLEIQHYCTTTSSTEGFGRCCNYTTEVYTLVVIEKIGA